MAEANQPSVASTRLHEAEDSDHVGSGASTPPPGTSTPNPDLSDKRLPGITNSTYFAQVCHHPLSSSSHPVQPPALHTSSSSHIPPEAPALLHAAQNHHDDRGASNICGDQQDRRPTTYSFYPKPGTVDTCPTPPISSASSINGTYEPDIGSFTSLTDGPVAGSEQHRRGSSNLGPLSRLRRHTLSQNALSNVVTKRSISAHISNPATSTSPSDLSLSHAFLSHELARGTSTLTTCSNLTQNTPPHTPRALSQHEPKKEVASDAAVGGAASPGPSPVKRVEKSSRSSSNTNEPPVSATKGTLSVSILQGRGLRPSTAPYVICIYQLNEDISDGPKGDAMDLRQDSSHHHHEEDLARGVAMRRMGSDAGRAMNIPNLGSRQSSQTDIAKLRGNASEQEVTEPVWNHEAVLYVS